MRIIYKFNFSILCVQEIGKKPNQKTTEKNLQSS